MKTVTYDGFQLHANGFSVTNLGIYASAPRRLQNELLARREKAVTVMTQFQPKTIEVEGKITADTEALLEDRIDLLKRAMNKFERDLDVSYGVGTRRYTVTAENVGITRERGAATYAFYSISFYSPTPFGYDIASVSLLNTTNTSANVSNSITVGGTFKSEPEIGVVLNSGTGLTAKRMSLNNPVSGMGISITRTWTAGDTVVIDVDTQQVFVNTTEVPYTGRFPYWEPGAGTLEYDDDFTTRNVTITMTHTARYL